MCKFLAFALAAFSALPLAAQQPPAQPLTAVAVFDVKPGKEASFMNLMRKYYVPVFDKLMTDGTVLAWGVDRSVFHHRDEPGYDAWFSAPNYAAVEKTYGAIEELRSKMSPADIQESAAAVSYERHYDLVLRDLFSKYKAGAGDVLPYTMINSMRVKPGMEKEWRELGEKTIAPIYDKLMEDGALLGYIVSVEEEHSRAPEERMVLLELPNLAARDKVLAALKEFSASQPETMQKMMSTIQEGSHRDETLKALIFKTKQ